MRSIHWMITIFLVIILVHISTAQVVDITYDYESPASNLYIMMTFKSTRGENFIVAGQNQQFLTLSTRAPAILKSFNCQTSATIDGRTTSLPLEDSSKTTFPLTIEFNRDHRSNYTVHQCVINVGPGFVSKQQTANEFIFTQTPNSRAVFNHKTTKDATTLAVPFTHVSNPNNNAVGILTPSHDVESPFLELGQRYSYSLFIPPTSLSLRKGNGLVINHPFEFEDPQVTCFYRTDFSQEQPSEQYDMMRGSAVTTNGYEPATGPTSLLLIELLARTPPDQSQNPPGVVDCKISLLPVTTTFAERTKIEFTLAKTKYQYNPTILPPVNSELSSAESSPSVVAETLFLPSTLDDILEATPIGDTSFDTVYLSRIGRCQGADADCTAAGNRLSLQARFIKLDETSTSGQYSFTLTMENIGYHSICTAADFGCNFNAALCPDLTVTKGENRHSITFTSTQRYFVSLKCKFDLVIDFSSVTEEKQPILRIARKDGQMQIDTFLSYAPHVQFYLLDRENSFRSPLRGGRLDLRLFPYMDENQNFYPIVPGTVVQFTGIHFLSSEDVTIYERAVSEHPAEPSVINPNEYAQPKMIQKPASGPFQFDDFLLEPLVTPSYESIPFGELISTLALVVSDTTRPIDHVTSVKVSFSGFIPTLKEPNGDKGEQYYISSTAYFPSHRTSTFYLENLNPDPHLSVEFHPTITSVFDHLGLTFTEPPQDPEDGNITEPSENGHEIIHSQSTRSPRVVKSNAPCTSAHGDGLESRTLSCDFQQSDFLSSLGGDNLGDDGDEDGDDAPKPLIGETQYVAIKFQNFDAHKLDQLTFRNMGMLKFIPRAFEKCYLVRPTDDKKHYYDTQTIVGRISYDGAIGTFVFADNYAPTLTVDSTAKPADSYTVCIAPFAPAVPMSPLALTDIPIARFNSSSFSRSGFIGSIPPPGVAQYAIHTTADFPPNTKPSYSLSVVSSFPGHDRSTAPENSIIVTEFQLYNIIVAAGNMTDVFKLSYNFNESTQVGLDLLTEDESEIAKKYLKAECPGGNVTLLTGTRQLIAQIEFYEEFAATKDLPLRCQFHVATLGANASSPDSGTIKVEHGGDEIDLDEDAPFPTVAANIHRAEVEVSPTDNNNLSVSILVEPGVVYRFLNVIPYHYVSSQCYQIDSLGVVTSTVLAEVFSAPALDYLLVEAHGSGTCRFDIQPTRNSPSYIAYWEVASFISRNPFSVVDVNDKLLGELDFFVSHISQKHLTLPLDPRIGSAYTTGTAIVFSMYRHNFFVSQRVVIPLPSGTILDPLFDADYHCDSRYLEMNQSYNRMNSTYTLNLTPVRDIADIDEIICTIPLSFSEPTLGVTIPVYLTPNQHVDPRWTAAQKKQFNAGDTVRYDLHLPTISSAYSLRTSISTSKKNYLRKYIHFEFTYSSKLYDVRSNVLQVDLSGLKIHEFSEAEFKDETPPGDGFDAYDRSLPKCYVLELDPLGAEIERSIVSHRYNRQSAYRLQLAMPPVQANQPVIVRCSFILSYYGFRMLTAPILTEFPTRIQTVATIGNDDFPLVEYDTFKETWIGDKQYYREEKSEKATHPLAEILCMDLIFAKRGYFRLEESQKMIQIIHSIVSLRDQKISLNDVQFLSQIRAPTKDTDDQLLVRIGFYNVDPNKTRLEVKFAGIDFVRYLSDEFSVLSYSLVDNQPGDVRFAKTQFFALCHESGRCGVYCGIDCGKEICKYDIDCTPNQVCASLSCRTVQEENDYLRSPFTINIPKLTHDNSAIMINPALSLTMLIFVTLMVTILV